MSSKNENRNATHCSGMITFFFKDHLLVYFEVFYSVYSKTTRQKRVGHKVRERKLESSTVHCYLDLLLWTQNSIKKILERIGKKHLQTYELLVTLYEHML